MPPRAFLDTEIELMQHDLIQMGALVEQAIVRSMQGVINHDTAILEEVAAHDNEIDDIEKAIESRALRLLMRQQPVARDLRAISAALKIITDLERIGDQAADIAELSTRFEQGLQISFARHLPAMSQAAIEMVHSCVEAYVKNDMELATTTISQDDVVDDMFVKVKDEVVKTIKEQSELADQAIDVMMVAKYLERIGDHAVNVCEWIIFYGTGLHKKTQIL